MSATETVNRALEAVSTATVRRGRGKAKQSLTQVVNSALSSQTKRRKNTYKG
jgi:hypothetical protein